MPTGACCGCPSPGTPQAIQLTHNVFSSSASRVSHEPGAAHMIVTHPIAGTALYGPSGSAGGMRKDSQKLCTNASRRDLPNSHVVENVGGHSHSTLLIDAPDQFYDQVHPSPRMQGKGLEEPLRCERFFLVGDQQTLRLPRSGSRLNNGYHSARDMHSHLVLDVRCCNISHCT